MKKVTLAIAMAALIIFAGCKKDSETKGTTLKASIEQNKGDGSKTSLNPTNGAILWTAGDKILVNNGTTSATFTLSNGAGSASGMFTASGEFELGENNVAVYPHTATISGTTIGVTLPATQTLTTSGTFGNGANPMLAVSTDDNLTFTSLCGGLGISLTGNDIEITAIEIVSANADDKLNGVFECTTDSPTLVATSNNSGTNRIMLECTATLTETPQEFYIVLPVGVLANGFTMNIYNGGEEPIFSKSTESTQLQVALNTVKTMNAVEVTTIPEGAINGLFTINEAGDQVYFSKGNLQYQASTNTWRFAHNQYDLLITPEDMVLFDDWGYYADVSSQYTSTSNAWIDHFGWGTSSWNNGNIYYQPYNTEKQENSYLGYGYGPTDGTNYNNSLMGLYANADWGVYNSISNGGGETGLWRTLAQSEWNYVFNSRNTSSGINYAKAVVNGVNGIILLPDNWNSSIYSLNNTNDNNANFNTNIIVGTEWNTILEENGAVFFPAAGFRVNTTIRSVGSYGDYWSASHFYSSEDGYFSYSIYFDGGSLNTRIGTYPYYGEAVRLVRDAE